MIATKPNKRNWVGMVAIGAAMGRAHHENDATALFTSRRGRRYSDSGSQDPEGRKPLTLSRSVLYGISAMAYLAAQPDGKRCGALEISEHEDIPISFLWKILQSLQHRGLVRSARGVGGGYQLALPANEISLMSIVKTLGSIAELNQCLLRRQGCTEQSPCTLHHHWADIRRRLLEMLETTTVADLVREHERGKPERKEGREMRI